MPTTRRDLLRSGIGGGAAALLGGSRFDLVRAAQSTPTTDGQDFSDTTLIVQVFASAPAIVAAERLGPLWTSRTGGTVEIRTVPYEDGDRAIRSIPQQADPPDVFLSLAPNIPSYAVTDILLPVTSAFTDADMADFWPGAIKTARIDGEFYGPPTNESSQPVYFNRAVVEKYGFQPPATLEQAWTWEQALEVFIEIQAKEREARGNEQFWAILVGEGIGTDTLTYTHHCLPRSKGQPESPTFQAVSPDGRTASGYINTPEALEGMQFLQDLHQRLGLAPISTAIDFFPNEQVAFWIASPYSLQETRKAKPDLAIGTTPFPYFSTPIIHTGAWNWCAAKRAKSPDAAIDFVGLCGSVEGSRIVAEEFASIPARQSLLPEFPLFTEPPLDLAVDLVREWAEPRPITPGFSDYQALAAKMLNDIVRGADAKRTADEAAVQIDRALERYPAEEHVYG